MTNRYLRRLAWILGSCQLAACASGPTDGTCFPVPTGVAVARTGMEVNGTNLQGAAPEDELQGTTLQGAAPGEHDQGTALQGAAPDDDLQGTTLQGAAPGEQDQGTSLQGGSSLRVYRGLGDLNGARLRLATGAGAVTVRDGELVAPGFADTAALEGVALDATAPDGRTFRVEVTSATLDGRTRRVELAADGLPVCDPGQSGVIVTGRWDAAGAQVDDPDVVTYSCASGVIAKCVTWGYAPWLVGPDVHAACTRLARADYCGDGTPWTLDGTLISVYDTLGVKTRNAGGTMVFEAAWSPAGAACVARTRYTIHDGAGMRIEPACFAALPTCTSLDDAAARGAVLANDSNVTPIAACD